MEEEKKKSTIPVLELDTLDEKVVANFPGKIVRKDLTALMKRGANLCAGVSAGHVLLYGR